MMIPIKYLNKQVGFIRADKTYITNRTKEHYFRIFKGFGISYPLLKILISKYGCKRIIIIYDDGKQKEKLITTPERFIEYGKTYRDKQLDYQKILPIKDFGIDKTLRRWQ